MQNVIRTIISSTLNNLKRDFPPKNTLENFDGRGAIKIKNWRIFWHEAKNSPIHEKKEEKNQNYPKFFSGSPANPTFIPIFFRNKLTLALWWFTSDGKASLSTFEMNKSLKLSLFLNEDLITGPMGFFFIKKRNSQQIFQNYFPNHLNSLFLV